MGTKTQGSPFRETSWDMKLDRMLDDLKTTVGNDESKNSTRRELFPHGGSFGKGDTRITNREDVQDKGFVKHYHKEYTSPDNRSKMVADQYEYEENDPDKSYHKKLLKSAYSSYKVTGGLSSGLDSRHHEPNPALMENTRETSNTKVVSASQNVANKLVDALSTIDNSSHSYSNSYHSNSVNKYKYDDDMTGKPNDPHSDVRKIVLRNRFEKTYEGHDGIPSVTIEEDARRKRSQERYENTMSSSQVNSYSPPRILVSPVPLQLQYAVYYPNVSHEHKTWIEPVPMPTPPQVSPKEPGLAYVYTYGENKSEVNAIPSVNYTTIVRDHPPSPVPLSQTSSYTTSTNYVPSNNLLDGFPKPPTDYPAGRKVTYDYKKKMTKTTYDDSIEDGDMTTLLHRHQPLEILENKDNRNPLSGSRDISVTINKYTTTNEHNGPYTSTPHPENRSRSASPEKIYRGTVTHTSHTHTDSLDRLRKHPHEGLPFPETSPITPSDRNKIPTHVDDLMCSMGEKHARFPNNEPKHPEIITETKVTSRNYETKINDDENRVVDLRRPETKNVAGPAVYYPPGHQQLFDESMHTMTLKENKRRGKAKWRMEKSEGMKESSKSGGSKGGMAMVPLCVPLCCGAACVIM